VVEEYKKKGMEWKDAQHLVNLLAQVTSVSTIALLIRDDKSFSASAQALFLTSVSSIMMYEGLDDVTPDTVFTPVAGSVVFQKILQFARGYEHKSLPAPRTWQTRSLINCAVGGKRLLSFFEHGRF